MADLLAEQLLEVVSYINIICCSNRLLACTCLLLVFGWVSVFVAEVSLCLHDTAHEHHMHLHCCQGAEGQLITGDDCLAGVRHCGCLQ